MDLTHPFTLGQSGAACRFKDVRGFAPSTTTGFIIVLNRGKPSELEYWLIEAEVVRALFFESTFAHQSCSTSYA